MVLGTSEVEKAYNTYMADQTEANLQGFIRSKPRDHYEEIEKKTHLEMIQDSRLPWEKRLEKRLFEKKNQILMDLCEDYSINHLARNTKKQLVSKLVSHFQKIPGVWELQYSSEKKKFGITNNDNLSSQIKGEFKEISSQNTEKNRNVITNTNEDQENVMTNKKEKESVITKKTKDNYIHLRISTKKKSEIQEKSTQAGYKSVSKYIIDVMTNSKNVITDKDNVNTKKQTEINGCCRQLISLMDAIFKIQYPTKIINQLLVHLDRKTDENLIERVRGYLDE